MAELEEPYGVFSSCERTLVNIEFAVECEQTEIAGSDITHNGRHHCFAIFLGSSQLRARGPGLLAQSSPNVYLKIEEIQQDTAETARSTALAGSAYGSVSRGTCSSEINASVKLWKLIGSREPEIGPRGIDSRDCRS